MPRPPRRSAGPVRRQTPNSWLPLLVVAPAGRSHGTRRGGQPGEAGPGRESHLLSCDFLLVASILLGKPFHARHGHHPPSGPVPLHRLPAPQTDLLASPLSPSAPFSHA